MVRKPKPSGRKERHVRSIGRQLYVFCEGKNTEPAYMERYKSMAGVAHVVVKRGKKNTPKELVEEARDAKKDRLKEDEKADDVYWVVFDRENVNTQKRQIAEAFDEARNNGISIAISNVCFEVWILLHFEEGKASGSYASCEDLKENSNLLDMLKELLGLDDKAKIELKKKSFVEQVMLKLVMHDNVERARRGAKKLCDEWERENPEGAKCYDTNSSYTNVHELLDAIDRFKSGVSKL